tara:strand:+ start:4114 stop:5253 length:1140 start_codon:yes stop_codon:yes gene_type:complete
MVNEIIKNSSFDLEQWKYTNINLFKDYKYNISSENKILPTSENNINLIDGKIKSKKTPRVLVDKIKNTRIDNIKKINHIVNSNVSNPFIKINSNNYSEGAYIYIKDNSILEKPLVINKKNSENKEKVLLNEKILIVVGNNVNAKIILKEYLNNQCYLNTVIQIYMGENSIIDFIHDTEKSKTTQICNFFTDIDSSSHLNFFSINIHGKLIKNNFFINLNRSNSSYHFYSLNLLNNNNHIDNYLNINHVKKNTTSSTYQKNILDDKSKCIFYAKAKIFKNSTNSEILQSNKNLVLSDKAVVHSNPQLEIHNNDVKCSHGSTTGELDESMLFYMRSRGIKLSDCKKIILDSFANSIINNIKIKSIKNDVQKKVSSWLNNVS